VAICNVSSLQVLRWFFASSLLELCVAREVWSHWGIWAAKELHFTQKLIST
jgi:hypothetical protein